MELIDSINGGPGAERRRQDQARTLTTVEGGGVALPAADGRAPSVPAVRRLPRSATCTCTRWQLGLTNITKTGVTQVVVFHSSADRLRRYLAEPAPSPWWPTPIASLLRRIRRPQLDPRGAQPGRAACRRPGRATDAVSRRDAGPHGESPGQVSRLSAVTADARRVSRSTASMPPISGGCHELDAGWPSGDAGLPERYRAWATRSPSAGTAPTCSTGAHVKDGEAVVCVHGVPASAYLYRNSAARAGRPGTAWHRHRFSRAWFRRAARGRRLHLDRSRPLARIGDRRAGAGSLPLGCPRHRRSDRA